MGVGKSRLARRQQHVAGQRQLETASHGCAVDRPNHRARIAQQGSRRVARSLLGLAGGAQAALARADLLEVQAGAKSSAGTGQDQHPHRRVGGQAVDRLGQRRHQRLAQRIHRLRPVERQHGVAGRVDFGEDQVGGHGRGRLNGWVLIVPRLRLARLSPARQSACRLGSCGSSLGRRVSHRLVTAAHQAVMSCQRREQPAPQQHDQAGADPAPDHRGDRSPQRCGGT